MKDFLRNKLITLVTVILIVVILAFNSLFIVYEGSQALLIQFGQSVTKTPITPGLHFKVPLIQEVMLFENRILDLGAKPKEVIAADQKRLIVDSYTKYRIIDPLLFYRTVRSEKTLALRVQPIIESSLRGKVGAVSLMDLLQNGRESVTQQMHFAINEQVSKFGINIVDVRIKRTDLPESNSEAIFNRMQTEREKEAREIRAKGMEEATIIRSASDKDSRIIVSNARMKAKIIVGEGDAKAAKIYNETYSKDPDFFSFVRHMELYKNAISDRNTKIIMSGNESYLQYLEKYRGKNEK